MRGTKIIVKNTGKNLFRVIIAGAVSFIFLNLLFFFYFNLPIHVPSDSGATDYQWEGGALYVKATEGFAFGRMDGNGYNNSYPHDNDEIDILLVGSSHMEATNVMPAQNTAYVLNELLDTGGYDDYVYNIGMSSHNFIRNSRNLEAAINEYQPGKFVVVETATVSFRTDEINRMLDGSLPVLSAGSNKLISFLERLPFLRLMNYQLNHGLLGIKESNESKDAGPTEKGSYEKSLGMMLAGMSGQAEDGGCGLVIIYHPSLSPDGNGGCIDGTDAENLEVFESLCVENNIAFINMGSRFMEHYYETNDLPHGFANTTPGKGHLNATGHRLMAEELYSYFTEGDGR